MNEPVRSFAIVPAAGQSTRMGRPKLLLPWGPMTVLEQTLAAWRAGGVSALVVVIRADDVALAEIARATGAQVALPESAPPDMKRSVEIGLQYVQGTHNPKPDDVWLLAPADTPTLSPQVIQGLLSAHDPSNPAILVPQHAGRSGHPVLIPWPLAERVSMLAAHEGINTLVKQGPTRWISFGSEAVPSDIDTPEDYERLLQR